jgi:putative molybdopterin biosynthesis protein
MAVGSLGGLSAAKREECDLAPIHLLDPATGIYNRPYLTERLDWVPGWRRMQGLVYRTGDDRFEGKGIEEAVASALADPSCLMVNRNQGAGTRILIDRLLQGQRPDGYWNQPKSHNAVAAAVAQGRADWGIAIAPVAEAYGLGFLPLGEEHYDFALVRGRREKPAVASFLDLLADPETAVILEGLGFSAAACR